MEKLWPAARIARLAWFLIIVSGVTYLLVLVATMEAYEAFTRRALLDDDNVKSFTTSVVLDRVKTGVAVPLGPPPIKRVRRR